MTPVKDPVGKPVTGLKEVRLLHNLIIQEGEKSRLLARGEIIDISLVPEHLRTDQLVEAHRGVPGRQSAADT